MHEALGLAILVAVAGALVLIVATALLVHRLRRPPRRTAAWAIARQLPSDPGERDLTFEEWWLERPGARLPIWDIRLREGERTAVVVHGWGQSRVDALNRLADHWEPFDRVILWDLRGHGDAEGGGYRLGATEAGDLVALLERLGSPPTTVIATGTAAAIACAAAGEAAVPEVVTVDEVAFWTRVTDWLRDRELPPWPVVALARAICFALGLRPPA